MLTSFSTVASRNFLRRAASAQRATAKAYFSSSNVEIEHYTSGWSQEDKDYYTQSDQFRIQTFNKISPKVRRRRRRRQEGEKYPLLVYVRVECRKFNRGFNNQMKPLIHYFILIATLRI